MAGIERDNPALKDVLPKDYGRPALDKQRLGQLVDLISNIKVGDEDARSRDVLGRVYEYFLSQFASAEGKKGGEFYTPRCVVKYSEEAAQCCGDSFGPSREGGCRACCCWERPASAHRRTRTRASRRRVTGVDPVGGHLASWEKGVQYGKNEVGVPTGAEADRGVGAGREHAGGASSGI